MWCLQNKEDEWKWNPMFYTGLVSLIHFSRGSAPCQDHTSKGTGESVFPGSSTDVLHFLHCLCAASLELVKLGRGPERNAVCSHHQKTPSVPWIKPVGEWAPRQPSPIHYFTEDKTHCSLHQDYELLCFTGSQSITFPQW